MKYSEWKKLTGVSSDTRLCEAKIRTRQPDTRVYDAQKAKKRQETSNQAGGKTVAFTPRYIRVPFSDEDLSLRESLEKRLEQTSLMHSYHGPQKQAQAQRAFKTVMERKEAEAATGVPLISLSPDEPAATEPTQSTWLQQPAVFADGWQFGDGMIAAGATMNDLGTNVLSGALGIGEKMVDAGAYYVGGIGGLLGQEDFQNRVSNFVADDLYDEQELARKFFSPWKRDHLAEKLGLDPAPVEENSLFGDKADSLAQAGGQLLGQALLTKLGIPYQLTSAATSFGGEVENALRSGATYGEAGISGLITAGSEVLLEQISGGINFANIGTLDRGMSKWLANTISNDMLRYVAQLGVDIFGEGIEEVFSDAIAKFGRWLTYQDEYTLEQLYLSEEARQEALDAFFGGAFFGGIGNAVKVSSPVNQDSIAYVTDTDPANPKMGVTPSVNVNDPGSWDLSLLPPNARKDAAAYLSQLQHLQTTQALLTQKEGILKSQLEAEKPNPTLIDQTRRDITKLEGMVGVQSDKLRQIESLPTIQKLKNSETEQQVPKAAVVEDIDPLFKPNGEYWNNGGEFDLNGAKADYGTFLTTAPEKHRIYLQQSFECVGYEQRKLERVPFGYSAKNDTIYYDPSNPEFWDMDFTVANTHELAHRVDAHFVHAQKSVKFYNAIQGAKNVILSDPNKFIEYAKVYDQDGFLSDILSAISDGTYDFPAGHPLKYWQKQGNKEKEIFANMFSLEACNDQEKLEFIQENFPELYRVYMEFEFEVK